MCLTMLKTISRYRLSTIGAILACGALLYLYTSVSLIKVFTPHVEHANFPTNNAVGSVVTSAIPAERHKHLHQIFYPFAVHEAQLTELLRGHGFVADLMHGEATKKTNDNVKSGTSCRCGRISDSCICCVILTPNPMENSSIPLSFHRPIILSATEFRKGKLPRFCFRFNYLLKQEKLRITGLLDLVDAKNPVLLPDVDHQVNDQLKVSPIKNAVKVDGINPENVMHSNDYTSEDSVELFEDVEIDAKKPPAICVINNKNGVEELDANSIATPTVELCLQFIDVMYRFDAKLPHKTELVGHAELKIVLKRKFILYRYFFNGFRMYRGAAADIDQIDTAQKLKKLPVVSAPSKVSVESNDPTIKQVTAENHITPSLSSERNHSQLVRVAPTDVPEILGTQNNKTAEQLPVRKHDDSTVQPHLGTTVRSKSKVAATKDDEAGAVLNLAENANHFGNP